MRHSGTWSNIVHGIALLCAMVLCPPANAQNVVYITDGYFLHTFDPVTCDTSLVGITSPGFGDIALTPDFRLFGISGSELHEVNTMTAATNLVATLPLTFTAVSLVALDNDHFLLESWDSLCVIGTDGSFNVIGHIGYEASGDLTWYQGDLYMTAGFNVLVRIRLNADRTAIVSVEPVGVMPTAVGQVYGAVTVRTGPCTDDVRMVAFDTYDAYVLDPATAATQELCMAFTATPVAGAASSAEFDLPPPAVGPINVFSPNGDGINDRFEPPSAGLATLTVRDRWGLLLYTGPARPGWDGRTPGDGLCPEGVYYYTLVSTGGCDDVRSTKGHVTLLR